MSDCLRRSDHIQYWIFHLANLICNLGRHTRVFHCSPTQENTNCRTACLREASFRTQGNRLFSYVTNGWVQRKGVALSRIQNTRSSEKKRKNGDNAKTGTDHGFFPQVPDRVRESIRDKRYSLSTEQSCVQRISRLGDLVPASLQTPSTPHNASTARSPGLRCLSRWRTSWNWPSRLRKGVETGAS